MRCIVGGIDVETVALHENGHSLGLGHFGPPPDAVMNPVYAGIRHVPLSPDDAAMSAAGQLAESLRQGSRDFQ